MTPISVPSCDCTSSWHTPIRLVRDVTTNTAWSTTDSLTNAGLNYLDDQLAEGATACWSNWPKYLHTTSDWQGAWTFNDSWTPNRIDPAKRLRKIIRSRQAPLIITSRKSMPRTQDIREMRARETLRRVLGEDRFRKFLKHGFVSVQAKSGLVYQIFPGHGMTSVYQNGKMLERLCVVLRGEFPPTDSLIMRYLLILNDEREFRSHAVVYSATRERRRQQAHSPVIPLSDVWSSMKRGSQMVDAA